MKRYSIALIAALGILPAPQSSAQSTFGSIVGVVRDPTQSVVPGATVTLRSLDDNSARPATVGGDGAFEFVNLKPGRYSLTAQAAGFADFQVSSAQLDARQTLRIDVALTLKGGAEVIEVQAEAAAINTENGTIGNTVTNQNLSQLPLNSRAVSTSPLAGLALSASVVQDSQGNIAVGGATSAQVGFSVDGISTANVRQNGALKDAYPSSEGISEAKITAFNNNAEFAQVGDVTFTTKSGTNQWHGSAFEYFQNSALDATIYNFPSKAPKTFNTFGGSFAGPVVLPKLGALKDRTFLFVDYEGNRKATSAPELLLVPTAAERSGNLSALVSGGMPLMNPFTGTPFPNNTIPTCGGAKGCLNPVATAVLQYYPIPNVNLNVLNPSYNYQTLVPIPSSTNGWDLRLDQNITSTQQVYARYSWKDLLASEGASGQLANQFLPNVMTHDQNRSLLISYNYSIRPNLLNEFRFGFTHFMENDTFPIQGSNAISELGLQGINISSHPTGDAFPTFNFSDGTFSSIGQDRVGTTLSNTNEITDNLTYILRKHTFRFGVDARRVRYNALMFFQPSTTMAILPSAPGCLRTTLSEISC